MENSIEVTREEYRQYIEAIVIIRQIKNMASNENYFFTREDILNVINSGECHEK